MSTATSNSSKSKRQSHYGSDKDIISSFPDEILSCILSFLPTQQAALTSILSQRWRYIWTLVPILDFTYSSNINSQDLDNVSFVNFVDRVLTIRRDINTRIQKFHLCCCFGHSSYRSRFSAWICHVIACGVRDLNLKCYDLDLKCYDKYCHIDLPQSIFTCKTLEVLWLETNFRVRVPDFACLPSLSELHLDGLCFIHDSNFENLIRNCPVLQHLVIERDELKNLKICSSSLKSLKIHRYICRFEPGYQRDPTSYIDTPFLEYLEIEDHVSGAYNISNLSSLFKANIDVWEAEYESEKSSGIEELFRGICNVKCLTLSSRAVKCFNCRRNKEMPAFCNLTHLEVEIGGGGWDWGSLSELLNYTSEFTNLIIEVCEDLCPFLWDGVPYMDICLSRLERIKIRTFKGTPKEMRFAGYILENAMRLKKMTIICSYEMDPKEKSTVLDKLTRFPKGSRICQLELP